LCDPEGQRRRLSPKTTTTVPADSTVRYRTAGAGGYGDPTDRPVAAVLADVRDGYVTVEAAREDYGVAVDPDSLTVDEAATARLREDG
jgi:N-methylhydantoinase B